MRLAPRVTVDDVGTFWLGPDGDVWRVITFCEYPSVSWEKVGEPGTRRGGAVGAPITAEFTRLVTEKSPDA